MENSEHAYDAYSPVEIAKRVEDLGVAKSKSPLLKLSVLSILAGAFISIGAIFFTVVVSDSTLSFGMTRLIGGICFSLGLVMVVIAGAELFTGNNLLAMAWVDKKISTRGILRNWVVAYLGNALGCLISVAIVYYADIDALNGGSVGKTAGQIAAAKASLTFMQAFARGVLCNALVCIAVWLVMGGRTVIDKMAAVIFPVTAFVTLGLEHSIANWFFLPYGMLVGETTINFNGAMQNIIASTLGNIVGGTVLVSGVYYLAYIRKKKG